MLLKDVVKNSNTGLDAIKRAPIVSFDTNLKCYCRNLIEKRNHWLPSVVNKYTRFATTSKRTAKITART